MRLNTIDPRCQETGGVSAAHLSHSELESIFLHVVDGIVVANEKGLVEAFNPAAEKIFGYAKDEVIGRSIALLMPRDVARVHDRYVHSYMGGREAGFVGKGPREVMAQRHNGQQFYADIAISEAQTARGRRFIAIVRDITERRAREAALQEAKDKAEEAAELARTAANAKSRLLSGMTHEFRTPLNAIIGFSEFLLLLDEEAGRERQREYVGHILDSGGQLLEMVNNLLEMARQDATGLQTRPRPLRVREFLSEICDIYKPLAMHNGLELALDIDPGIPERIVVDHRCLKHTITNLISNALKFTEAGHVRVGVTCADDEQGRQSLCIQIADTGIGVADDDVERMFEAFTQLDGGPTRRHDGSGLGLAICKQLCALMDGSIGYAHNRPQGAIFNLLIPTSPARANAHRPRVPDYLDL
jgi:PAS domain S-box-containing protein